MLKSNIDGMRALHSVLTKARARAFESGDTDMADVLDAAEYLTTCLMSDDDKTEAFREYLDALGTRFREFAGITSNYDSLSPAEAAALADD